MLAGWAGAEMCAVKGGGPSLEILALQKGGRSAVFCANLSDRAQVVSCGGMRMRLRPWAVVEG